VRLLLAYIVMDIHKNLLDFAVMHGLYEISNLLPKKIAAIKI
jgi:hypothetical protein